MKPILAISVCFFFLFSCKKNETIAPDNDFTGKSATSGTVHFNGLCTWSAEYINSTFDIKLDNSNKTVLYANIATTMKEKVIAGTCIPGAQQSQHVYTLSAFAVSGSSIVIYFKQDNTSFPQNIASFAGTVTATGIAGMLTLYRKSDGIFCKVEMPFQLQKTG